MSFNTQTRRADQALLSQTSSCWLCNKTKFTQFTVAKLLFQFIYTDCGDPALPSVSVACVTLILHGTPSVQDNNKNCAAQQCELEII